MNFRYVFMILLLLQSSIVFCARWNKTNGSNLQDVSELSCQCYCSDLCGPRNPDHKDDAPFYDEETGICFCQQRDKENYKNNGCIYRSKPFYNSCCKSNKQQPSK